MPVACPSSALLGHSRLECSSAATRLGCIVWLEGQLVAVVAVVAAMWAQEAVAVVWLVPVPGEVLYGGLGYPKGHSEVPDEQEW